MTSLEIEPIAAFRGVVAFRITGRGWAVAGSFLVRTRQATLVGSIVTVNGVPYKCLGVEWWALQRPEFWQPSDTISLLIDGEPPEGMPRGMTKTKKKKKRKKR